MIYQIAIDRPYSDSNFNMAIIQNAPKKTQEVTWEKILNVDHEVALIGGPVSSSAYDKEKN